MGLLDGLFATPSDQALWALGSGLLGVRRGNEGRAFMGAMGAYNDAQQEQRRNKLVDAQLGDIQAQADQRKATAEALLLKQKQQQAQQDYLTRLATPGFAPGATVMKPETMVPQQRKPNPIELMALGFAPETVKAIMEAPNMGRPEIAHWDKVPGANGPETVGYTKYGDVQKTGTPSWIADLDPNVQKAKLAQAAAGASKTMVNVNSFMPFQQEIQKKAADAMGARYEQLQDAPAQIQNIQKARQLVGGANPFVGSGAEKKLEVAKFFNNNFGTNIAPDAVKDAETLRTTLFMQIMDNLKKMDAQPSQMQQVMMKDALGNLNTDPRALDTVLGVMEESLRTKVGLHNKRVNEFKGRPGMENALPYDMTITLPDVATPMTSGVTHRYNPATRKLEAAR